MASTKKTARQDGKDHQPTEVPTMSLLVLAFSVVALARVLVGFQPHSGQDNWHGSTAAYGGDAEAQRHWMELTYHLPLGEWYYHDLWYWGLDYPPLTAYVSYACGALAHFLIGPHSVALHESRYREMDGPTKAFLRGTVLVLDMSVYSTAVWWLVKEHKQRLQPGVTASDATSLVRRDGCLVGFVIATLQPALILVDHGHFQYNTVALGLALWSFYFMTRPQFSNCVWGSILFVLALSFKQMTLYYAPAVFSYLLGRCAAPSQPRNNVPNHPPPPVSSVLFWKRFVALGLTVMGTFGVLWGPIVWYGPTGTTPVSRLLHVLRRVLPLERGLFESKVSNVWCVLSLRPVKIRERIPVRLQPVAAFALTTALMLPSCVALFRGARRKSSGDPTSMSERFFVSQHRDLLLRGTACCACAFFLASFQVHEKSLLLALAPASLLAPPLGDWFGIVATWTLWPLLVLDRLQTAYWCTLVFFAVALSLRKTPIPNSQVQRLIWLSYAAMAVLHGLELAVPPPSRMPDLFPVLWSVLGCALVSSAWLVLSLQLLSADHPLAVSTTLKTIKLA